MGGNATGIIKRTGEATRAQKVDFLKVSRSEFIEKTLQLLIELNNLYYKNFNEHIWNEEILKDGTASRKYSSFLLVE